jgi:hypothetical protein
MANRARGDAELCAGGRIYTLRLTLGALAEIEDGLGLNDLSEIEERLKKLRAADLAIVAAALMRGGGHDICVADALRLPVDLPALLRAVTQAFACPPGEGEAEPVEARPFPGPAGSKSHSA